MTLGSQKMIVGNQKSPSIIFQQRRLGEFCFAFFFRSVERLNFVCLGFFGMQIIYSPSVCTQPAKHQETI